MENKILEDLKKSILEYNTEQASELALKALEENISPVAALDVMTDAIREVGEGFGSGELFLPELMGAAEAMQGALPHLQAAIKESGEKRKSLGTVIFGTVLGDMHTIGKAMVSTLLTAAGFEVIDLGINVAADQFIQAVKEHDANIIGMSALLTTTAMEAKVVIDALKDEGLRDQVKVMVGGGAITEDFALDIGADGYDATAPGAVELAKKFMAAA